ncbi:glycerol-3-phosphate responsive antiterminator [Salimicrobium halophilum]|uniref:Glycerol uptake operon antiterminator regulatory protein n=1 Tax=Salimicrobium halophilum TaxID=86666 RepID=A0A1G8V4T0_9BACI|nr:glycerol-3-phosphate responsive antiterminator [Salimicrobium halophilum]SDJ61146.1 glycerol uptake operon antiterminator [Salimicrobium halophilum]
MIEQKVLPAVRRMKDFETLLDTDTDYLIFLETRIGLLKSMMREARKREKKVFIHADLVQGLKTDEYGMEYLGREIKPDGIISTRSGVIQQAKRYGMTSVQRLFLIDSQALSQNIKQVKRTNPDYIELLPGVLPGMIREMTEDLDIPIIAGGLIRTSEEVDGALEAGAVAVTTSRSDLWRFE